MLAKILALLAGLLVFGSPFFLNAAAAEPAVVVEVHIATQTMDVTVDGSPLYEWKVSTARPGRHTPEGIFMPLWLDANHHSRHYHHAPMPWSIFFYKGFATHGTTDLAHLGTPASHGCVRLDPKNAHTLFDLVTEYGKENTQIVISQ